MSDEPCFEDLRMLKRMQVEQLIERPVRPEISFETPKNGLLEWGKLPATFPGSDIGKLPKHRRYLH
jgi:hypothetical protein